MEAKELIDKTLKILASFKPTVQTVDSHVEESIKALGIKDPEEQAFVQQAFYGINRADRLLRVFLNALYHLYGGSLPRTDVHLFKLLAYLAIFRLDEIGFSRFATFLASQEVSKMHRFLSCLFDEAFLLEWVKEGWCKFLDRGYVEGTLFGSLARNRPAAQKWLTAHQELAFGAAGSGGGSSGKTSGAASAANGEEGAASPSGRRTSKRAPTIPVAPRLTQPRLRALPEPERIGQSVRANPVPSNLDSYTLEDLQADAEERKAIMKRLTVQKYYKAAASSSSSSSGSGDEGDSPLPAAGPESPGLLHKGAPRLHETRSNLERIKAEVEAERQAQLRFEGMKASAPPPLPTTGADVKLTAAAILREEAVYRKKQAEDAAIIARFEAELRDSSEFDRWRAEMKEKEELEEKIRLAEKRKMILEYSVQHAAEVAAAAAAEKARQAEQVRLESKVIGAEKDKVIEADRATKRVVAQAIKMTELAAPEIAKTEVVTQKKTVAAELKETTTVLQAEIEERRRREQQEKKELIRRIRIEEAAAAERAAKERTKTIDFSATSGARVLEEMSLAELKERITAVRAAVAEQVEEKRRQILEQKRLAQEVMRARVANLSTLRAAAAEASAAARAAEQEKTLLVQQQAAEAHDAAALALSERLAKKRAIKEAERERLRHESEMISKRNLFLGAGKQAIEERRMQAVSAAAERRVVTDQQKALQENEISQRIRSASAANAARYTHAKQQQHLEDLLERESAANALSLEAQRFKVAETKRNSAMFLQATEQEATLKELRDLSDPFAAAVRAREREVARSSRAGAGAGSTATGALKRSNSSRAPLTSAGAGLLGNRTGSAGGTGTGTGTGIELFEAEIDLGAGGREPDSIGYEAMETAVLAARLERVPLGSPLQKSMSVRLSRRLGGGGGSSGGSGATSGGGM